jgi:cell division protein FtsZ
LSETGGGAMPTFELIDNVPQNAVIKVIGVGGGGGNAVRHMITNQVDGVEFICANTDAQALRDMPQGTVLKIGNGITKGLGAGANPDVGRQAALEDRERIAEVLRGSDMVFIAAGMGGGTGTGAAPIVAQVAKDMGILTVAVVTKPFSFEGKKRMGVAMQGLGELAEYVDSLIIIPNEKLLTTLDRNVPLMDAFKAANDVLLGAVQGIADLIIRDGLINVDFADVRTVMREMGMAMMGTGKASGENRAREAAEAAIRCPLLDNVDLQGARGILVNITCGFDLSMGEYAEVGDMIRELASDDATVVVGTVVDPEMSGELKVTVVATGLGQKVNQEIRPTKVVDNTVTTRAAASGKVDYAQLDRPAVMRNQAAAQMAVDRMPATAPASPPRLEKEEDLDYLDIPAFLRRQVD